MCRVFLSLVDAAGCRVRALPLSLFCFFSHALAVLGQGQSAGHLICPHLTCVFVFFFLILARPRSRTHIGRQRFLFSQDIISVTPVWAALLLRPRSCLCPSLSCWRHLLKAACSCSCCASLPSHYVFKVPSSHPSHPIQPFYTAAAQFISASRRLETWKVGTDKERDNYSSRQQW